MFQDPLCVFCPSDNFLVSLASFSFPTFFPSLMCHVEPQVNASPLPQGLVLYISLSGVVVHYLSTPKCLCFTQKNLSAVLFVLVCVSRQQFLFLLPAVVFPSYPCPTPPAPFAADGLMLDSCRVSTVKPFTSFTFNL